jgi:hypothetical protein
MERLNNSNVFYKIEKYINEFSIKATNFIK